MPLFTVLYKFIDYPTKLNYLFRGARFFLMKSNNAENIALSKAKSVWSTLPINETKLNQSYQESRNVILVYSVKESGKFAGVFFSIWFLFDMKSNFKNIRICSTWKWISERSSSSFMGFTEWTLSQITWRCLCCRLDLQVKFNPFKYKSKIH